MDETMMHEWIDVVLKPWKESWDANNSHVQLPIGVLDAYLMHQMGSMVN
jgi:hypothetical protein